MVPQAGCRAHLGSLWIGVVSQRADERDLGTIGAPVWDGRGAVHLPRPAERPPRGRAGWQHFGIDVGV